MLDYYVGLHTHVGGLMIKETTCSFTGHRPKGLPWGYNENDKGCIKLKKKLKKEIVKVIKNEYTTFITGMALGCDTICAEIVLQLKFKFPNIKIIGVLPCREQDRMWNDLDKRRYRDLLCKLDEVIYVNTAYSSRCMLERNRYMIDNSSLLIAVYNGTSGGTKYTIDYARINGVKIIIVNI